MDQTIRVPINGREYPLRIRSDDEGFTREIADLVDRRIKDAARQAPGQPDLTHTIIAALAMGEELRSAREELDHLRRAAHEMTHLTEQLDAALRTNRGDGADLSPPSLTTSSTDEPTSAETDAEPDEDETQAEGDLTDTAPEEQ